MKKDFEHPYLIDKPFYGSLRIIDGKPILGSMWTEDYDTAYKTSDCINADNIYIIKKETRYYLCDKIK